MCTTLFLTASRGGFITLLVTGAVGLWIFGVKGRRPHLVAAALLVALIVGVSAGGRLKNRFLAISGEGLADSVDISAHGSYEQRRQLMVQSLRGIVHYPLGIGLGNFPNYSGTWREVHVAYLQIAIEGGIASCILYILFFSRGFSNLRQIKRLGKRDKETELLAGAMYSSLVGFLVGAFFAPEAYQFFPYFAVAYTAALWEIAKEQATQTDALDNQSVLPQSQRRFGKTRDLASVR
jgi:O-antigen ligase